MATAFVCAKVLPTVMCIPSSKVVKTTDFPESDNSKTRLASLAPVTKVEETSTSAGGNSSPDPLEEAVARQASGIELRIFPDFGRCLFASAGDGRPVIKAGTTLIAEEPLMQVAPQDVSSSIAMFLAFAALSDETRCTLLGSMCRPNISDPRFREQPHGLSALKEAQAAKASHQALLAGWTVDALADFWLCCTFNSHRYYGGAALFLVGSKLNHACRPNSVHRTWGLLQSSHVAVRDIQLGEEVTTSYLDTTCAMRAGIWSTPARLRYLGTSKLFICNCKCCTSGIDKFRGLPCPKCPTGTMYFDNKDLEWECECCREQIKAGVDDATNLLFKRETIAQIEAGIQSTNYDVDWFDSNADHLPHPPQRSTMKVYASCSSSAVQGTRVESYLEATVLCAAKKVESVGQLLSPVVENLLEKELAEVEGMLGHKHWITNRHKLTCAQYNAGALRALCTQRVAAGPTAKLISTSVHRMAELCNQFNIGADHLHLTLALGRDHLRVMTSTSRHHMVHGVSKSVVGVGAESLSHYLQSARVLLDHILPAAESWFEEPGGVGPLPGHGLRSREALKLQLLKVEELEVLLGAIQTEVVFEEGAGDNEVSALEAFCHTKAGELASAMEMGGRRFFCVWVPGAEGDLATLQLALSMMNAPPANEHAVPGASIAKMLCSMGEHKLVMLAHVPEELASQLSAEEWLKELATMVSGEHASIFNSYHVSKAFVELSIIVGVNAMLVKSVVMEASYDVLRERFLVPDAVDEHATSSCNGPDEDDCLYGSDADSIIECFSGRRRLGGFWEIFHMHSIIGVTTALISKSADNVLISGTGSSTDSISDSALRERHE